MKTILIGADKSECKSIIDPSMPEILSKRLVVLQPGSPCDNNKGLVSYSVNIKKKVKISCLVVVVCIYL